MWLVTINFVKNVNLCNRGVNQIDTSYILIGKRPVKDKKYKQNVKKYKNLQKNSRKRYYYPINVIKYI